VQEKILILDFGSQYTQLIARRVRELNVYCEIHPYNKISDIDSSVKGVIYQVVPALCAMKIILYPILPALKVRYPCWEFAMVLNFSRIPMEEKCILQNTENTEEQTWNILISSPSCSKDLQWARRFGCRMAIPL
jgi:hypothetical protein